MARLRYTGLKATLGAALNSTATTITLSGPLTYTGSSGPGTAVPTVVSGDYVALSIQNALGVAEVVHLVAYTAGATTGTIIRGRDGTIGVAHADGVRLIGAATAADFGLGTLYGAGSPQGVVAAMPGTDYVDTDATNGAVRWTKMTGSGNSGWSVSVGDTGVRNISSLLVNGYTGSVFARRVGDLVTFHGSVRPPSPPGASKFIDRPAGFGTDGPSWWMPVRWEGSVQIAYLFLQAGDMSISGVGSWQSSWGSMPFVASAPTRAPWPTALPGVAA